MSIKKLELLVISSRSTLVQKLRRLKLISVIGTILNDLSHSLAAYCLVCYFLQVKDRHNGNILLHKTGKVIHIDFGFFLSIAPGKGLEFEKNVPFKLLSENIEILGGVKSSMFNHFRKLFFK